MPDLAPPPKARPIDDTPSRWEAIVDAATRLFAQNGYASTSIQDIAEAVGMNKASLYHYIHGKEDLLEAIVLQVHAPLERLQSAALAAEGTARDKLQTFVANHVRSATENLVKVHVFYTEYDRLPAERFQQIVRTRDQYEETLREIINLGAVDGSLRTPLDPTLTAISIFAMLNSIHSWFRPDGKRSVDDVIASFLELILDGLGNTDSTAGIETQGVGPGNRV